MRANLAFNPLKFRGKWAIEAGGLTVPFVSRGFRQAWAWPAGASYEVDFGTDVLTIYEDGEPRVRRDRGRWHFDGQPLRERARPCAVSFRLERGPGVLWLRAGPGRDHALVYPAGWHDRLPLLCGMGMAALGNYDE